MMGGWGVESGIDPSLVRCKMSPESTPEFNFSWIKWKTPRNAKRILKAKQPDGWEPPRKKKSK